MKKTAETLDPTSTPAPSEGVHVPELCPAAGGSYQVDETGAHVLVDCTQPAVQRQQKSKE